MSAVLRSAGWRGAVARQSPRDAALVALRPRIEAAIDRLIAALGALDGDPDLEAHSSLYGGDGTTTNLDPDLTGGVDGRDDDDGEPWLGSLDPAWPHLYAGSDPVTSQLQWAAGGLRDCEADAGDEGEADTDAERSAQPASLCVERMTSGEPG